MCGSPVLRAVVDCWTQEGGWEWHSSVFVESQRALFVAGMCLERSFAAGVTAGACVEGVVK